MTHQADAVIDMVTDLGRKAMGVIEEYASSYQNDQVLRALFQLLPFGAQSDFLLARKVTDLYQRRLEELLKTLVDNLSAVERDSLNLKFFETEEFLSIFVQTVEMTMRTVSAKKRRHAAEFLSGVIRAGCTDDLSEQIEEDLRFVQDFHLTVLASIPQSLVQNQLRSKSADFIIDFQKLRETTGFDWLIFNKAICDLETRGFIKRTSEATGWQDGVWQTCRPTQYLSTFNAAVCNSETAR